MTRRASAALAIMLFGVYLTPVVVTVGLIILGPRTLADLEVLLGAGFAVVGLLVALREPGNAVGWLLLTAAAGSGLQIGALEYVISDGNIGDPLAAWFSDVVWYAWFYCAGVFLPLLFPTGRLLSRRWRAALVLGIAALVLTFLGEALHEGPIDVEVPGTVVNPFGVSGSLGSVMSVMGVAGGLSTLVVVLLGPVSLVLRFRRSRGREREQLKVFALVGVLVGFAVLAIVFGATLGALLDWQWALVMENVGWGVGLSLVIVGLPVAVGVAILRHRLYDIDVVINRTLVYGVLTAALVATYVGSVLLLRIGLSPFVGHSDLQVAVSTLVAAAVARPARARIQAVVDRRFYRRRYDASRTLEAFAGRLRQELDLDAVGADLRAAAIETVQPAHVSLWLLPDARRPGPGAVTLAGRLPTRKETP